MSKEIKTQVVVLGAGPAGYSAAFRAADLGLDTVIVERYSTLGGVCLNVGCIPSKALLHAAALIDEASHSEDIGISFGKPKIDLDKLRGFKQDKVVGQFTKGLAGMAKQRKVRTVTGVAKFVSPNELEIVGSDGKTQLLRFEQCIIAAGSQAVKLPNFPWDDPRVMDSTDALQLAEVPKKLLVVGGGIIGLEMATVYRALGAEVTVVEFMDQLMPGADKDLVKPLADRLKKQGVIIQLKTKAAKVEASKKGITVHFESATEGQKPELESGTWDRVLVAVGRSPNGGKLDADKAPATRLAALVKLADFPTSPEVQTLVRQLAAEHESRDDEVVVRVHVVAGAAWAKNLVAEHADAAEAGNPRLVLMKVEARMAGDHAIGVPCHIGRVDAGRGQPREAALTGAQDEPHAHTRLQ